MNINNLDLDVESLAHAVTEKIADENPPDPSNTLLPSHVQKERLKLEIVETLKSHFLHLANGINYLLTRMQQMTEAEEPIITKQLFESIVLKLAEKKTDELSAEELTALFAGAVEIYNSQEYEQAADALYLLTEFDPGQALFWKWLGNARFHTNQFKDAIEAYTMALAVDEQDPEPLIYQARALESENRIPEAISMLESAQELIAKNPQFEQWKETASVLLQELER